LLTAFYPNAGFFVAQVILSSAQLAGIEDLDLHAGVRTALDPAFGRHEVYTEIDGDARVLHPNPPCHSSHAKARLTPGLNERLLRATA
jgi:hypothetical protein